MVVVNVLEFALKLLKSLGSVLVKDTRETFESKRSSLNMQGRSFEVSCRAP